MTARHARAAYRPATTRKIRGPLLALVPLALLALAACAAGGGSTPSNNSSGVVSSGPLPPPSSAPMGPNTVTPEAVRDATKQAFTKVEAGDGNVVRVEGLLIGGPPCNVIGRADVSETASQVTITLWAGPRPDAKCDGPQATIEFPFVLEVTLARPLADRTVVDGAL